MESIPTLTLDGFVTNKKAQMVKLFEYFLASDKSQSNVFNDIQSLKYILTQNKNMSDLKTALDRAIMDLYKPFFTNVTPDVIIKESDTSNVINIYINIKTTHEGKMYELTREVTSTNGDYNVFDKSLANILEEQGIL